MEITEQTVMKVANLAQLSLSDDELVQYQKDLGKVIEFFDQLRSLDLPETRFSSHESGAEREDVVLPSLSEPEVLLNAPLSTGSSFTVPRIIESK